MKKKLAAALAVLLLLTGCGAQGEDQKVVHAEQTVPPAAEAPAETPEAEPELQVEQVPMEINPDRPMCEDGAAPAGEPVDHETVLVEGLVEDTVGYTLEKPVFEGLNGADKINSFYENLILNVENFCKSQIYDTAVRKSGIASAYGTVDFAELENGILSVQYRFRAEFSDETEQENVRIDSFDPETGDVLEQ